MIKTKFPALDQNSIDQIERDILKFWDENQIFQKSVDSRDQINEYVFYDGPPFATGLPHYGHFLASIIKDVVPRYKTMCGHRVERVWGWDCHGLPIENIVEKECGTNSKKEIEEKIGVFEFNEKCRSKVLFFADEWEKIIHRLGRWVDFRNGYKTMDKNFMESVMWLFAELHRKNLIYEGRRISLYCPRCETPLSNFEIAMDNSYQIRHDATATVKFRLVDNGKDAPRRAPTYILAWTTTPWTLPSNFALAVNPELMYLKIKKNGENLIVAENLAEKIFGENNFEIVEKISGADLVGQKYEPLFPYFSDRKDLFQIFGENFVSDSDGTGIVHLAPYGEDDFNAAKKRNLEIISLETVDDSGKFKPVVSDFAGEFVLAPDLNRKINKFLDDQNKLFKAEQYSHNYPHCWRCETPLFYNPQRAYFLDVQKIKSQMLANNEKINWEPEHLKTGRFAKGLETAPDWNLSRNRFWGSPIPIWKCENCDHEKVFGSIAELEKVSGQKVSDLHKHFVDKLSWPCEKCGRKMSRTPEVLDCWFESGAMPYAQKHFPFEEISNDGCQFSNEENIKKEKIKNIQTGIENMHEIITTVNKENFWKTEKTRKIGELPEKVAKQLKIKKEVYLSDRLYGKIRNWWRERHGHEEVKESDFYFIPALLSHPANILIDKESGDRIIILSSNSQSFVLILDDINGHNEILSFFVIRSRGKENQYLNNTKRYEKMTLEGLTIPSCIPASLREDFRRLVVRISSRQGQFTKDVIKFFEESQLLLNEESCFSADSCSFSIEGNNEFNFSETQEKTQIERCLKLRRSVFGEEQKIEESIDLDGKDFDKSTVHFFAESMLDRKIYGTCRVREIQENIWKLERMAVFKNKRGQQIGRDLLNFLKQKAKERHVKTIKTEAQVSAQKFYEKSGFKVSGKIFEEFDTPHVEMKFDLEKLQIDNRQLTIGDSFRFPGDFIAEYIAQTRGWFYTLHVLSTALFDSHSFKNVICTGTILAEDGNKMSKSKKNYPDPSLIFEKYGSDPMRFYLMASSVMKGENFNFSERGVAEVLKSVILPLRSAYQFFQTYANIDGWQPTKFIFVRHGEGDHNLQNIYSGRVENPHHLTEKGRAQVFETAKKLPDFDVLATSPFVRTRETADILLEFGNRTSRSSAPKEVLIDENLRESEFGGFEGQKISTRPERLADPKAEEISSMVARAEKFIQKYAGNEFSGKTICAVSHGDTIRAARTVLTNFPRDEKHFGLLSDAETGDFITLFANPNPKTELDLWILSELQILLKNFREKMDAYKIADACELIPPFIDYLNNWFLRRSRKRFWATGMSDEKISGYETLFHVLTTLSKILAPVCPFFAEKLWRDLNGADAPRRVRTKDENSVHLEFLPFPNENLIDQNLSEKIAIIREISSLAAGIRARKKIKLRQPLEKLSFAARTRHGVSLQNSDLQIIAEEANVKKIEILTEKEISKFAKKIVKVDARKVGPKFGAAVQKLILAGKNGDFEILENGGVKIGGEILDPSEFEIAFLAESGFDADGTSKCVVILDTEISENLRIEGIAREIIRAIQETRKTQNFEISDRIFVEYFSNSADLKSAFENFGEMISDEVLAEKIILSKIELADGTDTKIDDAFMHLKIFKN